MTDPFIAQKRSGSKDTVHLYDGSVEEKNSFFGMTEMVEPALCSGEPLYQPTKNNSEAKYGVSVEEIEDSDYLIRNGVVIGKLCGTCKKAALGRQE